jgi:hypothetical protein
MNDMHKRLDRLFDADTKARWRIIVVSAVTIATCGVFAELNEAKTRDAQIWATVVGVLVFSAQVLWYARSRSLVEIVKSRRRTLLQSALAVAVTSLLAIFAFFSAPAVEAAILNRRLREALEPRKSSSEQAIATSMIIKDAVRSQVKLRADLIRTATSDFEKKGTPEAWQAVLDLMHYHSSLIVPVPRLVYGGLDIAEPNRYHISVHGEPFPHMRNSGITVRVEDAALYEKITEHPNAQFQTGVSSILVEAGSGMNLDGFRVKHVTFKDTSIFYDGGPLELEDVYFGNCTFYVADNLGGRQFSDVVIKSNAVTVRIGI